MYRLVQLSSTQHTVEKNFLYQENEKYIKNGSQHLSGNRKCSIPSMPKTGLLCDSAVHTCSVRGSAWSEYCSQRNCSINSNHTHDGFVGI